MSAQPEEPPALLPLNRLLFDSGNPRLRVDSIENPTQKELFDILWRDFAVDELVASISANGFFTYEPLFVEPYGDDYIVIEGNRRLAAVKALTRDFDVPTSATSIPKLTAAELRKLENLPAHITTRSEIWQYVGFKHVNGPQAWQSASKAEYIAWVKNMLNVPLAQITARIGDKHATVQRLYRALMVVEQAEDSGVWTRSDRTRPHFSFSHLYTGLDYTGISEFISVKPAAAEARRPVPRTKISNLGELCVWLFGSRSNNRPAVVQSQNPDLRRLDKVLQNKDSLAALRKNLPLETSEEIARGDVEVLRESLVTARTGLQVARGRVLTGYKGEADLLRLAGDVSELAFDLHSEMQDISRGRRGRRSSREMDS
jgi:hypothetical protein